MNIHFQQAKQNSFKLYRSPPSSPSLISYVQQEDSPLLARLDLMDENQGNDSFVKTRNEERGVRQSQQRSGSGHKEKDKAFGLYSIIARANISQQQKREYFNHYLQVMIKAMKNQQNTTKTHSPIVINNNLAQKETIDNKHNFPTLPSPSTSKTLPDSRHSPNMHKFKAEQIHQLMSQQQQKIRELQAERAYIKCKRTKRNQFYEEEQSSSHEIQQLIQLSKNRLSDQKLSRFQKELIPDLQTKPFQPPKTSQTNYAKWSIPSDQNREKPKQEEVRQSVYLQINFGKNKQKKQSLAQAFLKRKRQLQSKSSRSRQSNNKKPQIQNAVMHNSLVSTTKIRSSKPVTVNSSIPRNSSQSSLKEQSWKGGGQKSSSSKGRQPPAELINRLIKGQRIKVDLRQAKMSSSKNYRKLPQVKQRQAQQVRREEFQRRMQKRKEYEKKVSQLIYK